MLNFFHKKERSNLIYVLDFLLQVSIRGEEMKNHRKIDLELYKILNRPDVNQTVFHAESLPITRKNQNLSKEFAEIIHKLTLYIEYDVMNDFVWAQVAEDPNKQNQISQKIIGARTEILTYLLNKKVITISDFETVASTPVKSLMH